MSVTLEQYTPAGGEAGTPPDDRKFRPDVQGMRAVAIFLALVYHAGVPGFSGGYVGIEVFFVISGFVITGLLLRERAATHATSLRSFYGRRARRILPAATLVIIVTVVVSYHSLGPLVGHETAVDGQWAALFLANIHFQATHTNYLVAQAAPSPLLNYWSLGVEEQFYIVYPTLILLVGWWARKGSLRTRLTLVLVAIIVASYAYSIIHTSVDPQGAYFSLLTRSWELALGGLIALHGHLLRRIPGAWAALASWVGLAMIMITSVTLNANSVYPGALVAIPTLGAGLVIAAGASQPTWGVERMLRLRPFQFLAAISFPLYLWHWPILQIAAQARGVQTLPVWDNVGLLVIAGVLSTLTYYFFENPIRHARILASRRWASIVMGVILVAATLAVTTYEQHRPVVNLGTLSTVTAGSQCASPASSVVSHLRSTYLAGESDSAAASMTGTEKRAENGLQQVALIGDSTSCTLLPGLQAVGPSYGMSVENAAVIGCGVVSGEIAPVYVNGAVNLSTYTKRCQGEANFVETRAIQRYHPSLIVWGSTDEDNSIVNTTASGGSGVLQEGTPQWKSVMLQRMDDRVKQLLATGAKVILLLEAPPAQLKSTGPGNSTNSAYARMNSLLEAVAARHRGKVATVDLGPRLCPSGPPCPYVLDGYGSTPATQAQAIRPDGVHYLPAGSLWVARWLVPKISAAERTLS
jgi:peptidoglycan/LPS O-acetylase OafA/YrhL